MHHPIKNITIQKALSDIISTNYYLTSHIKPKEKSSPELFSFVVTISINFCLAVPCPLAGVALYT